MITTTEVAIAVKDSIGEEPALIETGKRLQYRNEIQILFKDTIIEVREFFEDPLYGTQWLASFDRRLCDVDHVVAFIVSLLL